MHTISEAASRLRSCDRTIYRLINRGDLERMRVGRSVFITEASLAAYLAGREVTA